jgi:hypothetical protein
MYSHNTDSWDTHICALQIVVQDLRASKVTHRRRLSRFHRNLMTPQTIIIVQPQKLSQQQQNVQHLINALTTPPNEALLCCQAPLIEESINQG